MKNIVAKMLGFLTRLILAKFKPVVIGITGSVGKTTTREAIYTVLSKRFSTRASIKSYNNSFGLPFTVLDQDFPGKNPLGWLWLFVKSFLMLIGGHFPQVLILEMGADKPGDIAELLKITGLIDYAVVTDIGMSHLMNYSSLEALAKEKLSIVKGLKENGTAVLNLDNNSVAQFVKDKKTINMMTFGLDQDSSISASEIQLVNNENGYGLMFKVKYEGNVVAFMLQGTLGRSSVYAALAACSVAVRMGMNLVEASQALTTFNGPPGRLKLIEGIKHTQVIDDTYNAAPSSTNLALEILGQIAKARKVAAIGGMAELGAQNEKGHKEVAAKIQEVGLDLVFLVGENAKIIRDELEARHFSGKVKWFENSDNARIPIQNELQENDTILVKGSQSARMEKIVKEIMNDPMQAEKLLVRQSAGWL